MGFEGTTRVTISVDTYNRAANTTGALTELVEKDIESFTFQLPNGKTVRVDGLAEVYEHMIKTGKWVMPDAQIVLKTDISSSVPAAGSAYAILGRPEEAGAPTRTLKVALTPSMYISWEVHQDSVGFDLPKDGVIMSTHNIKHATGTAPTIVGF